MYLSDDVFLELLSGMFIGGMVFVTSGFFTYTILDILKDVVIFLIKRHKHKKSSDIEVITYDEFNERQKR